MENGTKLAFSSLVFLLAGSGVAIANTPMSAQALIGNELSLAPSLSNSTALFRQPIQIASGVPHVHHNSDIGGNWGGSHDHDNVDHAAASVAKIEVEQMVRAFVV